MGGGWEGAGDLFAAMDVVGVAVDAGAGVDSLHQPDAASVAAVGGDAVFGDGDAEFGEPCAAAAVFDFVISGVVGGGVGVVFGAAVGWGVAGVGAGAGAGRDSDFAGSIGEHGDAGGERVGDAAGGGVAVVGGGGGPV